MLAQTTTACSTHGVVLDAEIDAFRRLLQAAALPDPRSMPVDGLRHEARLLRLAWNKAGPAMARSQELELAGLRCRLHWPVAPSEPSPVTIYLHGGGWTLLDIDTHDDLARRLASDSGRPVLLVDYPRAPEHRFPAPLLRLRDLVVALRSQAGGLALTTDFALCGDSAGANLTVALALMLRDEGSRLPRALGLIYGSFADNFETRSHLAYGKGDLPLSTERMRWFWSNYVPDVAQRRDPLVNPLHADLGGLPPTFMIVAQYDALYDENMAFADRLASMGNDLTVHVYPGTIHAFIEAAGAVGAAVSKRAIRDLGLFLARLLEASA
jgi:acetyl esterase